MRAMIRCPCFFSRLLPKLKGGPMNQKNVWLSANRAKQISGATFHTLQKLALSGRLRYTAEPGETIRYHAEDVQRLAEENGRPHAMAMA